MNEWNPLNELRNFVNNKRRGIDMNDIPHWVETDRAWECSKCKGWGLPSFAFCPHCGKEMEEENENA